VLNAWLENGHYLVHSSTTCIFKHCSEFFSIPYLHLFNNSQWFAFQQDGKWFSQHRCWTQNFYNCTMFEKFENSVVLTRKPIVHIFASSFGPVFEEDSDRDITGLL